MTLKPFVTTPCWRVSGIKTIWKHVLYINQSQISEDTFIFLHHCKGWRKLVVICKNVTTLTKQQVGLYSVTELASFRQCSRIWSLMPIIVICFILKFKLYCWVTACYKETSVIHFGMLFDSKVKTLFHIKKVQITHNVHTRTLWRYSKDSHVKSQSKKRLVSVRGPLSLLRCSSSYYFEGLLLIWFCHVWGLQYLRKNEQLFDRTVPVLSDLTTRVTYKCDLDNVLDYVSIIFFRFCDPLILLCCH